MVQISHPYMTTGKNIPLTKWTFSSNVSSFLYMTYVCYNFSFKEQASFNFIAAVTTCSYFGAQENKVFHCFHCCPIYLPWSDGTRFPDILFFFFLNVEFQDSFFTLLFHFIKKFFNSSLLFTVRLVSSSYLRLFIFLLTILIPACVSSSLAPEYTWCTLHIS